MIGGDATDAVVKNDVNEPQNHLRLRDLGVGCLYCLSRVLCVGHLFPRATLVLVARIADILYIHCAFNARRTFDIAPACGAWYG